MSEEIEYLLNSYYLLHTVLSILKNYLILIIILQNILNFLILLWGNQPERDLVMSHGAEQPGSSRLASGMADTILFP